MWNLHQQIQEITTRMLKTIDTPLSGVIATSTLACLVTLAVLIAQVDSHRLASLSRTGLAAVSDSAGASWISDALCSWFTLCPGNATLTIDARERAYQPVVVYEPKQVAVHAAPRATPPPRYTHTNHRSEC